MDGREKKVKRWTGKAAIALIMLASLPAGVWTAAPAGAWTEAGAGAPAGPGTPVAAGRAADGPPPIRVYLDGEPVAFDTPPVVERGTTLVPFRPLFARLGYAVRWDGENRTVLAVKGDRTIALPVDGKEALVDGEAVPLAVPPRVIEGRTYVPLRFVADQTGRETSWDGRLREIFIADRETVLRHVLRKHFAALEAEDEEGALAVVDPASPYDEGQRETLGRLFADHDLHYEAEIRIVDARHDRAEAEVRQTVTGGAATGHADHVSLSRYRLVRVKGEWKIHAQDLLHVDYSPFARLTGDALGGSAGAEAEESDARRPEGRLSDADRRAILELLEQSRANMEEENLEAERSLYVPDYPGLEERLAAMRELLHLYDFNVYLGEVAFLAESADEAVVAYSMLVQKTAGPFYKDSLQKNAALLKKTGPGSWKVADVEPLSIDYRVDAILAFLDAVSARR